MGNGVSDRQKRLIISPRRSSFDVRPSGVRPWSGGAKRRGINTTIGKISQLAHGSDGRTAGDTDVPMIFATMANSFTVLLLSHPAEVNCVRRFSKPRCMDLSKSDWPYKRDVSRCSGADSDSQSCWPADDLNVDKTIQVEPVNDISHLHEEQGISHHFS